MSIEPNLLFWIVFIASLFFLIGRSRKIVDVAGVLIAFGLIGIAATNSGAPKIKANNTNWESPANPEKGVCFGATGEKKTLCDYATVAAQNERIDPLLFHALITAESLWNPAAISHAGAMGLGQVMPFHAVEGGQCAYLGDSQKLLDPQTNLACAAKILKTALVHADKQFPSNACKAQFYALAEYNAGRGGAYQKGALYNYPETRAYAPRIMRNYNESCVETFLASR